MSEFDNWPGSISAVETNGRYDVGERMALFIDRTALLTEFAHREMGAYQLFCQLSDSIGVDYEEQNREQGFTDIHYCPVGYQPDPSDSDTRRQIELRKTILIKEGKVRAVIPWLRVFTMQVIEEHGSDTNYAEPCFMRTELEIMCGHWQDQQEELFNPFFEFTMPGNTTEFRKMIDAQADYIKWLQITAETEDLPQTLLAPMHFPGDSLQRLC